MTKSMVLVKCYGIITGGILDNGRKENKMDLAECNMMMEKSDKDNLKMVYLSNK